MLQPASRPLGLLNLIARACMTRAFCGEFVQRDPAEKPASASLAMVEGSAAVTLRRGRRTRVA